MPFLAIPPPRLDLRPSVDLDLTMGVSGYCLDSELDPSLDLDLGLDLEPVDRDPDLDQDFDPWIKTWIPGPRPGSHNWISNGGLSNRTRT